MLSHAKTQFFVVNSTLGMYDTFISLAPKQQIYVKD